MRTHRAQIPCKQTSKTKSYIEGAWRKEKTTRRAQSPSINKPSKRRGLARENQVTIEGARRKEKTTRCAQSPSIKRPSKRRGLAR